MQSKAAMLVPSTTNGPPDLVSYLVHSRDHYVHRPSTVRTSHLIEQGFTDAPKILRTSSILGVSSTFSTASTGSMSSTERPDYCEYWEYEHE